MAGQDFSALQHTQRALVRKMVRGSVFIAPSSADAIETLTDSTDKKLAPLPAGYVDLGLINDDGAQFARDVESSDITSWGSTEPSRSDITSDVVTLQVNAQETNLMTLSLYIGADLADFVPDETSGEVKVLKPGAGDTRYFRALVIGVDKNDAGEIYIARYLPRCKLDSYEDMAMQSGDDTALEYGVTLKAFTDDELGASEIWMFGGPGWQSLLTEMGFFSVGLDLSVTDAGSGSVAVGDDLQLTVTASNAGDSDDVTSEATYVSSDPTKATVSAGGLVTGVAAGSATITVSFGGKTATHPVTVT